MDKECPELYCLVEKAPEKFENQLSNFRNKNWILKTKY